MSDRSDRVDYKVKFVPETDNFSMESPTPAATGGADAASPATHNISKRVKLTENLLAGTRSEASKAMRNAVGFPSPGDCIGIDDMISPLPIANQYSHFEDQLEKSTQRRTIVLPSFLENEAGRLDLIRSLQESQVDLTEKDVGVVRYFIPRKFLFSVMENPSLKSSDYNMLSVGSLLGSTDGKNGMKLSPDMKVNDDFILVNRSVWTTLLKNFFHDGITISTPSSTDDVICSDSLIIDHSLCIIIFVPQNLHMDPAQSNAYDSITLHLSRDTPYANFHRLISSIWAGLYSRADDAWTLSLIKTTNIKECLDRLKELESYDTELLLPDTALEQKFLGGSLHEKINLLLLEPTHDSVVSSSCELKRLGLAGRSNGTIGEKGLSNLGNTCFMNSALQCLSHVKELTTYFLSDAQNLELNVENVLGMQGQIALAYARLLHDIFKPTLESSVVPSDFKRVIGRYSRAFAGYGQQDSQEFISFLLDALHEDLNRVREKPYTDKPEAEDISASALVELADKCWHLHKLRNDSIISDLIQGQYKSTVTCLKCGKISVTFDPFTDLSCPLPLNFQWIHDVKFISLDHPDSPCQIRIELPETSTIYHLRQHVAFKKSVPLNQIIVTEVFNSRFYRIFKDSDSLVSEIHERDQIVIYELPSPVKYLDPFESGLLIPVINVYQHDRSSTTEDAVAIPFFVVVDPNPLLSVEDIKYLIMSQYEKLLQGFSISKNLESDIHRMQLEVLFGSSSEPFSDCFGVSNHRTPLSEVLNANLPPQESVTGGANNNLDFADGAAESNNYVNAESTTLMLSNMALLRNQSPDRLSNSSKNIDSTSFSTPPSSDSTGLLYHYHDHSKATSDLTSRPVGFKLGDMLVCCWSGDTVRSLLSDFRLRNETFFPEEPKATAASQNQAYTLYDCLREFSKEEDLGEDDLWYCPRCKTHQRARKKLELWRNPDILIIHLKRFSGGQRRRKINALIQFPLYGLDIEEHVGRKVAGQQMVYDLIAADNHFGGLGGGHYTAFAKSLTEEKFYHFDGEYYVLLLDIHANCVTDSRVALATEDEVVSPAAYLLFYRRRSSELGGKAYRTSIMAAQGLKSGATCA